MKVEGLEVGESFDPDDFTGEEKEQLRELREEFVEVWDRLDELKEREDDLHRQLDELCDRVYEREN